MRSGVKGYYVYANKKIWCANPFTIKIKIGSANYIASIELFCTYHALKLI